MNLGLWLRQALIVMKMELQRYVLGRRWVGVYLAAYAPVFILTLAALYSRRPPPIEGLSTGYAIFYQTFALRLSLFFSCVLVFSQLFRGEVLEKTLHFYLLTPVRREVLILGKYLAGVLATAMIFGSSTLLTHFLVYLPNSGWKAFFLEGNGMSNMGWYFLVTIMACFAYGAVFLLAGLLFKNPAPSALLVAGWETFFFILPQSLQKFTVMHYLQSMLPVGIDLGPFAVLVDPTPAIFAVPALLGISALFVWIAGQAMRFVQVTYSAD